CGAETPCIIDHMPAQNRLLDSTLKRLAFVRRHLVTVVQHAGRHDELGVRLEDDKVRIMAGGQRTLATTQAYQMRRSRGHPAHEIGERDPTPPTRGPDNG